MKYFLTRILRGTNKATKNYHNELQKNKRERRRLEKRLELLEADLRFLKHQEDEQ